MDEKSVNELLSIGAAVGTGREPEAIGSPAQEIRLLSPKASFSDRNARGLEIDTETGAPAVVKFNVALRDDPDRKLQYLQEVYGEGNARLADTGEPLIKILGDDGKAKEIKVNEDSFTLRDLAAFAASTPEVIGGAASMFLTRKVPMIGKWGGGTGVARDVVAESVGSEMLGGVPKDAVVAKLDNAPLTAQALIESRAKNIPLNIALGGGLEVGARIAGKTVSPFAADKGAIEAQQAEARQYFKDRFGIDVPMTAGEQTGSRALQRVETTMSKLPGSSKDFSDIRTEKSAKLARIQNRMLDLPEDATPADRLARIDEETLGGDVAEVIQGEVAPLQGAVESARTGVAKAGTEEIIGTVAGLTQPKRQLYPEQVGKSIRAKAVQLRDEFGAESKQRYEDTYKLPGGSDRILEPESLSKNASKLLDEMPSKEVVTIKPTGVTDAQGNPITKDVKGREVLREFVPDGVVGKLTALKGLKAQKLSLRDMVSMRSEVDNAIAQGEAIPGVQTHYLGKIRGMMTDAINEATAKLPDGTLKQSWEKANAFYKDNVGKFHDSTIARLFKDIESRGFVQDEDIVRNIGPTEYKTLKGFLGEASPEFQSLKRSIADTVIEAATLPGQTVIDGKGLIQQLSTLRSKNRSVFDDIFGKQAPNIQRLGELLNDANAKIDKDKFQSLLAGGKPLTKAVDELLAAQKNLDTVYRAKIIKDIAAKNLGQDGLDPSEFVNRFYSHASVKEVRAVIEQLHDRPDLMEKVRQKVIERVFHDAQRAAKDIDASRLGRGEIFRPSSSSSLDKVFGDEARKGKLELILGAQTYKDFDQLSKLLRGSEMTESAFAGAGGLAAGMQVSGMMRNGIFQYATDYVKQKAYAIMLTSPPVRALLANRAMTPARAKALGTTLLVSRPFIEAMTEEFGEQAEEAMLQLKDSAQKASGGTNAPNPKAQAIDELLGP